MSVSIGNAYGCRVGYWRRGISSSVIVPLHPHRDSLASRLEEVGSSCDRHKGRARLSVVVRITDKRLLGAGSRSFGLPRRSYRFEDDARAKARSRIVVASSVCPVSRSTS